jgi:hypothetical protein
MYKDICKLIKSKICNFANLFVDTKTKLTDLNITDGVINLNGYTGLKDNYIVLCTDDNFICDENNKLSSDIIFNIHQLTTSNTIDTRYKYVNVVYDNIDIYVLENIRVMITVSEELAFETFKNNPNNYIFVVPTNTTTKKILTDEVILNKNCKIVVMLHNLDDIMQVNNLENIDNISNLLISVLSIKYQINDVKIVLGTMNSIIATIDITKEISISKYNLNNCYLLDFVNPKLKDEDNIGELELIKNISD